MFYSVNKYLPTKHTMQRRPLKERVEEFVAAFPNAKRIPIHPNDLDNLVREKLIGKYPLPFKVLGQEGEFGQAEVPSLG